jgi:uncharacterized protein YjbI with pentapeptide repeats
MTFNGPPPTTPPSSAGALQPFRDGADRLLALVRGSPVRSGAVLGALLLISVAGAPLATRVWEAFWSLPYAGRIVLCSVGLAVIGTATVRRSRLQLRQRAEQARLGSVIAVAWAVVIAVVGLLVAGAWWVMGAPTPTFPDPLPPRALDALATRAFAIVAGLGAAALLVIHYRRQRTTEADAIRAEAANVRAERAAEREVTKLFNERFTAAYTELGSEHAAVRLGAVHALAHLADDAPSEEEVQMVIDVLCAYLRMPYTPRPDAPSEQPDQPVLPSASPTTVIDLSRLRNTEPDDAQREKQQAAREEHRRRVLEFKSFQQVRHTIIRIIGNHLREPTRWRGKNYDFTGVVFDGGDLREAVFSGATVSFTEAKFTGGAVFSGATVSFTEAKFTGGTVFFSRAVFSGATVSFTEAKFTGGRVSFGMAVFSDGEVFFGRAVFSGATVFFGRAVFSGATVSFREAEFTGGEVSFDNALGERPDLPTDACRGDSGVVRLPESWLFDAGHDSGQHDRSTPDEDTPDPEEP